MFSIFEFNNGVKAIKPNESYPFQTPTFRMGLHVNLKKKKFKDEYINHSARIFDGHLIFIHKNEEFPMKTSKPFYSQVNDTISLTINPQLKVIDVDLYKISL